MSDAVGGPGGLLVRAVVVGTVGAGAVWLWRRQGELAFQVPAHQRRQECDESLAAPVLTRAGRVVAAVCIVVVRPDLSIQKMERDFLPALRQIARAISDELGYGPEFTA